MKRAILATTLGIELKPAQVGLKVQGRELKLAWAQLLATLSPSVLISFPLSAPADLDSDSRVLPTRISSIEHFVCGPFQALRSIYPVMRFNERQHRSIHRTLVQECRRRAVIPNGVCGHGSEFQGPGS